MPLDAAIDERSALLRPDLAEGALEGVVRAGAYRPPTAMRARTPVATIRLDDGGAAELLFGEAFDVLEIDGDAAWGRARRDGRVGRIDRAGLEPATGLPDHRVAVLGAAVRAEPRFDAGTRHILPLNALVVETARRDGFVEAAGLGWIAVKALAAIGDFDADPASAAERFLGAPIRTGGRTGDGIDGPGLVQQALFARGLAGPPWPDRQAELGRPVAPGDARRGDLAFWPGAQSGGVMADARRVIHACAAAGRVIVEGLDEAERAAGAPAVLRRLDI